MSNHLRLRSSIGVALLVLIVVLNASIAVAQTPAEQGRRPKAKPPTSNRHYARHSFKAMDGTTIDYWVMSPARTEKDKKYPLVLALHGRGGNTMAATMLGSERLRKQFPCFVMAPASTRAGNWATPRKDNNRKSRPMLPAALEAMDALIKQQPIDSNRLYVTGQSMGGYGTFGALTMRPNAFAAGIPVCGGWDPGEASKIKQVPVWIFHGDQDKTVPAERSRAMVEAIKAAGGSPKYTEYPGVGHNSWTKAYSTPETWKWLFTQKRSH